MLPYPFKPEEFFLNPVAKLVFIIICALGIYQFARRAIYLIKMVKAGKPENRIDQPVRRLLNVLKFVLGQRRLLNLAYIGSAHFVIFWGFVLLSFGTLSFLGRGLIDGFRLPIIETILAPAFLFLLDVFSVLVIIGLVMAGLRRIFIKPLKLSIHPGGYILLGLIFLLVVTDLIADGIYITMTGASESNWMPIGAALASVFGYGASSQFYYWLMFWAHLAAFWALAVYVLYSKHLHIFVAPFNVFFYTLKPRGELEKMELEESESFGATKIEDFRWKNILDLYACTECGRCTRACPAYASGKSLSPRDIIIDLRDHFLSLRPQNLKDDQGRRIEGNARRPLVEGIIKSQDLWACTTCFACQDECPVFIEHVPIILEMRRNLVLTEGQAPSEVAPSLRNIEQRQNPFGVPQSERPAWTKGLGVKILAEDSNVEYLLWAGCYGAFDNRNKDVLIALAKLLNYAQISYGILGEEEHCCGDPARRLGDDYNFQMLAQTNVEIMNGYSVTKIVTPCPHGYNTIKNEYGQFGGNYEVYHHSELISKLLKDGRLKAGKTFDIRAAYHDSCYLGRYNDIYDSPRDVIRSVTGAKLIEMKRHRRKSFCCGAGGGRMWMEENSNQKVNQVRVEEAHRAGADNLITACPFCLSMLEDGLKGKNLDDTIKIRDIAELLIDSIEEMKEK